MKHFLITGGTSGIGLACALKLHEAYPDAKLSLLCRNSESFKEKTKLFKDPLILNILKADLANTSEIKEALRDITPLTGVALCAGIAQPIPFKETPEDVFDKIMDVNFKSNFFLLKELVPSLLPGSSVVAVTSLAQHKGIPAFGAYSSSKASMLSMIKTLAVELAPDIRFNAVCPGAVDTEMWYKLNIPADIVKEHLKGVVAKTPLKKMATASDVADSVLFMLSDKSSFITGQELVIDGGISLLS